MDLGGHHRQRFPSLHKPLRTFRNGAGYMPLPRLRECTAIDPDPPCRTLFLLHDSLCAGMSSPGVPSGCSRLAYAQVPDGNTLCVPLLHIS